MSKYLLLPLLLCVPACGKLPEVREVLVAREDLPQWTPLRSPETQFKVQEIPRDQVPTTHVPPTALDELKDRVLSTNLRKGQVVTWADLDQHKAQIGPGVPDNKRAFVIELPVADAKGILPGARVDVLLVARDGKVEAPGTLTDVPIAFVEINKETVDVTLVVSPEQALEIAQSTKRGTLRLKLRAAAPKGSKLEVRPPAEEKRPVAEPPGQPDANRARDDTIEVLVSKGFIRQWTPLRQPAEYFEVKRLARKDVPPAYVPPAALGELRDRPVTRSLAKGNVLCWEDLQSRDKAGLEAQLPAGTRGFSIKVTPETAVGGFVLPDTRVDVIHIDKDKEGRTTCRYVLENVLVRAVNQFPVRPEDRAGMACRNVTLELTPAQCLTLAKHTGSGTLRLTLRSHADRGDRSEPKLLDLREQPGKASKGHVKVMVARGSFQRWMFLDEREKLFVEREVPQVQVPDDYLPPPELSEIRYRALRSAIAKSEVLRRSHLQDKPAVSLETLLPKGLRAFAVPATPETAGCVLPGSHVDVILVLKGKEGVDAVYTLENMLVRGVDQVAWRPDDRPGVDFKCVTLEVSPEEALKLSRVMEMGTLRLSLRPFGDTKKSADDVREAPPPPPIPPPPIKP